MKNSQTAHFLGAHIAPGTAPPSGVKLIITF